MPFDLIRACATGSVTTRFAQPANIRQVLDMRTIQIPAVVRVRGRGAAVELPDFFAMIDQQARMVVSLARTVGEILQGKESAYSVRLLDLEQRREELRRRNLAAVGSAFALTFSVDEILWTVEALDRAAARLFRTARGFHQLLAGGDEVVCQMMRAIQSATESLQRGYSRLANGSPAAEADADAAIGSKDALRRYPAWGPGAAAGGEAARGTPAEDQYCAHVEQFSLGHVGRLYELYGSLNQIADELAGAGAILKRWSKRLSAELHDLSAGSSVRLSASRQCLTT